MDTSSLLTFLIISLCSFFLTLDIFASVFFHNFLCIFHNSTTIQGTWMDLNRDVDPDKQARCPQVE